MKIENAKEIHLKEINEITNYSIINTNYNLNFEPKTLEDTKKWYNEHKEKNFPIIVCLLDEQVVGWASLSTFRDYRGYDKTVEVSAITGGNEASINLHKKFGYSIKCTFEQIGYKNDTFLDVLFLYKIL